LLAAKLATTLREAGHQIEHASIEGPQGTSLLVGALTKHPEPKKTEGGGGPAKPSKGGKAKEGLSKKTEGEGEPNTEPENDPAPDQNSGADAPNSEPETAGEGSGTPES
jgi:hypothetical protein